jgi:hypothetical protein
MRSPDHDPALRRSRGRVHGLPSDHGARHPAPARPQHHSLRREPQRPPGGRRVGFGRHLGFGRIVASEIEVPILLVNLV